MENTVQQQILAKLRRMALETSARPFVFRDPDGQQAPFVSLPIEAEKYLTPDEMAQAKEIIAQDESSPDLELDTPDLEVVEEETEMDMSM